MRIMQSYQFFLGYASSKIDKELSFIILICIGYSYLWNILSLITQSAFDRHSSQYGNGHSINFAFFSHFWYTLGLLIVHTMC